MDVHIVLLLHSSFSKLVRLWEFHDGVVLCSHHKGTTKGGPYISKCTFWPSMAILRVFLVLVFFWLCHWTSDQSGVVLSDILYKQQSISMQNFWAGLVFLHLASIFTGMGGLDSKRGWTPARGPLKINRLEDGNFPDKNGPFVGDVLIFWRGNSSLYIPMVLAVSRNHVLWQAFATLQEFARVVRGASCAFRLSEGKPLK